MRRAIIVITLAVCAIGQAQTSSDGSTSPLDRTPQENASTGSLREHAPGTWVRAAIERHRELIQARVNNPRSGEAAGTTEGLTSSGSGGTSSSGNLSGSLLDLVSQLGGSSALTGGLSSLIGSLGGSGAASGGMTIEDLLRLRDQLLGGSTGSSTGGTSSGGSKQSSRSQAVVETREDSGAIGRLPKVESRSQQSTSTQSTTDDRKFVVRLADGLADAFFSAVAAGMRTTPFINLLKEAIRPLLFPTSGDNSEGSGGSNSGSGSGGGIEDLNPSDGGSGGSGSVV
jgi:hypothetical protein